VEGPTDGDGGDGVEGSGKGLGFSGGVVTARLGLQRSSFRGYPSPSYLSTKVLEVEALGPDFRGVLTWNLVARFSSGAFLANPL
jgi:hypothetical protein